MSGFAGMVCSGGAIPDPDLLERMAAGLGFRGPDATQIWSQVSAGFCFTLLRTGPSPQSSQQPHSLDGRVWLLGDVRLDGREDLQRELEQSAESFSPNATDEDLILGAWRHWREEGLGRLLGDFSFALWDGAAHQLLCVRDLMGARPLFYASSGSWFFFSNTLEVLRLAPGVSSTLDPEFIGDFLLQEWSSDASRTVYNDIHRLPPGHWLKYSPEGLCIRRYTALPIEEPLWLKRPEEYIERFQSLLEQTVRDRLPQEPSAIFLSGGLDSTSVAAVATKIARNSGTSGLLRAYTIDSRPLFQDEEGILASLMAKHLGIDIQIVSGASSLPYQDWEEAQLRTPEPTHDPFLALSHLLYRQISSQVRVAFTGYGGDDVLTGQAWPYLVYLLRQWRFGTIGKTFGSYLLKHKRIPPLRGGFRTRLRKWIGRTDPLTEFPSWLEPHFVEKHHLRERWLELQQPSTTAHPLHPIGYAGLSSESWSSMYETEDAGWTATPLESRAPLLDLRLLRFLLRVPPVPWCMEKELLREAMRGILPEAIRSRPKTPLPVEPLDSSVRIHRWSPLPLPEPPLELRTYVDWQRLGVTLQTAAGSTLWVGLRPVSLGYWLKALKTKVGLS
ncbi:MAG: asparagine synthetase B family protein [Candidatus Acidiferrum sp.]